MQLDKVIKKLKDNGYEVVYEKFQIWGDCPAVKLKDKTLFLLFTCKVESGNTIKLFNSLPVNFKTYSHVEECISIIKKKKTDKKTFTLGHADMTRESQYSKIWHRPDYTLGEYNLQEVIK